MKELRLLVPTFIGGLPEEQREGKEDRDFDDPHVPVLIREAAGVRIVLGSHDFEDEDTPDVQIERRPNGWAIFLHPLGGSDPSAYVYFLDDGRSFLVKEHCYGPTEAIEVCSHKEAQAEVDRMNTNDCPCAPPIIIENVDPHALGEANGNRKEAAEG